MPSLAPKNPDLLKNDQQFLRFIHERLVNVHGEDPSYGYMHRLREILYHTPKDQKTGHLPKAANDMDELIDLMTEEQDPKSQEPTFESGEDEALNQAEKHNSDDDDSPPWEE